MVRCPRSRDCYGLEAGISPIPKDRTKDSCIPLNYRGISLLSNISKLYTSVINKRLLNYLEINNIIVDEQNGFRPKRSCEDHITSIIRNRLVDGRHTFVSFVDFQKAFDYVNRNILFYKLLQNNIDGKMYHTLKAIYTLTNTCVKINDKTTDWFTTRSGVRQGDCLSPTLFSLFLNDFFHELNALNKGVQVGDDNITVLAYADDIAIITESEQDMQIILNTLENWCKKWRVIINCGKTKLVHFRKKRIPRSCVQFHIGENIIEYAESYTYLMLFWTKF